MKNKRRTLTHAAVESNPKHEPSGYMTGDYDPVKRERYYIRVDRIHYSDGYHLEAFANLGYDPWPTTADGAGEEETVIQLRQ